MSLRPFRHKRVLLFIVAVLLVATVMVATAVSGRGSWLDRLSASSDGSMSSADDLATTTTGSTPGTSNAPTTRGPGLASRVIQWMNEQAPVSGGAEGPEEWAFFTMLEGDCAAVLRDSDDIGGPGRALYKGAASACLAAFEGRPELWPRAEAALEKTTKYVPVLACESKTVYKLLKRLVDAHRAEPHARLVKRSGPRQVLKCPRFTSITPDHGPAEGGYTVRLKGENLPRVVGVNLDVLGGNYDVKHHVTAVSQDGRHLVITVPPATNPDDPLFIWPDGARLWLGGEGVEFKYDPPSTTTRRSTTTSTTGTTRPQPTAPTSTTTLPPSSS